MFMRKWFLYKKAMALMLCGQILGASEGASITDFELIGGEGAVVVDDTGGLVFHNDGQDTVGGVSNPFVLVQKTNALLVQMDITNAESHAVTLIVNDAETGEPLGYWKNPLPIAGTRKMAVHLPFASTLKSSSSVRLFIGTHSHASTATVANVVCIPLNRSVAHLSTMYGAIVKNDCTLSQSFIARREQLGGVVLRIRHDGKGARALLNVRLLEMKDNIGRTRQGDPIVQVQIPAQAIVGSVIDSELDLFVPLKARVKAGKRYLIELSSDDPDGFLLYSGLDGYSGGEMFINNHANGWDLRLEIFDEVR